MVEHSFRITVASWAHTSVREVRSSVANKGARGDQQNEQHDRQQIGQPTGNQDTETTEGKIKAASCGGPKWPPRLPKM
jgi:hypothetical protein